MKTSNPATPQGASQVNNAKTFTPSTDALRALQLFMLGPEGEGAIPPEVIDKELESAGVNVKKMAAEVRERISQAQNRLKLLEARGHLCERCAGA